MNEEDIFPTFDSFGPLKDVAIIRDKHTGLHRGCAFITFWSFWPLRSLRALFALWASFSRITLWALWTWITSQGREVSLALSRRHEQLLIVVEVKPPFGRIVSFECGWHIIMHTYVGVHIAMYVDRTSPVESCVASTPNMINNPLVHANTRPFEFNIATWLVASSRGLCRRQDGMVLSSLANDLSALALSSFTDLTFNAELS